MTRIVSQDPDGWVLVTSERALLAVAPDAADLPDQLEGRLGAGFAATLEALVARGIVQSPAFALLDWSAGPLRSVLRGAVTLDATDAGRPVSSSGAGVQTWSELLVDAPADVTLRAPGWTVTLGRVTSGSASAAPASASAPAPAAIADVPVSPAAAPAPVHATVRAPAPAPAVPAASADPAPAEAPSESDAAPDEAPVDPDATIVPADLPRADPPRADPRPSETPAADGLEGDYDYLFGDTVFRTVAGAAVRVPAEDADQLGDHDGETVVAGTIPGLGERERSAPGESVPPPAAPTFSLSRGGSPDQPLARGVVIGRAPSVSNVAGGSMPDLVTITDDGDISRNHVRISIEGDAPVVTDLGSKNGTTVVQPGKQPQKLRASDPTVVLPGTVVDLGGGIEFTIREDG